jgi:cyclase
MQQFSRGTVIGGHMGRFPAAALDNAIHYLDRLQDAVVRVRASETPHDVGGQIALIPIEACLAPQVEPAPFERQWHRHNLEVIVEQSIFALDSAVASWVGNA